MSVLDDIREYDPEYEPVDDACRKAAIPRSLFAAALNRVFYDGYYGPVSAQAWIEASDEEEHAEAVARTADALGILERVSDEIEGYRETFFVEQDGEEVEWTQESVSADDLRREVLAVVLDVYGRLPW